jgi:hypothetical protein
VGVRLAYRPLFPKRGERVRFPSCLYFFCVKNGNIWIIYVKKVSKIEK